MSKITSLDQLADELENAPEAPPIDGAAPPDQPPVPPPDDRQFGGRPRGEIFDGCPVIALGVSGDVNFYLDVQGQLRAIDNHTLQKMLQVFGGRKALLAQHFPTFNRDGEPAPGKFNQLELSAAMISACDERGVWSPTGRVRGTGCWTDEDGGLVIHAGDAVFIRGEWRRPGVYDGKVYAAADPIPRPALKPSRQCPAQALLGRLETWNWRRGDIDPVIALGLICAQMVGGALEWRPVGWLTGDAATGKSTFQSLLLQVHGGEAGLLQAADATEAGIRSVVGYSSLPVAIDELEPDPDRPQKTKAVVELARRASSGAQIFRGSTDQKGYQSNAYSCFLFSSILVPDMPPQDRSRLILLDLDRLPADAAKPKHEPRVLRELGAQLRLRLVRSWSTWPDRLEAWRAALARQGQTGRGADNYGTVLALADMVLREDLPDEDQLTNWASKLGHAITEEAVEVGSNAEDMLTYLMGQFYDVYRRGEQWTVGQWVQTAADLPGAPSGLIGDSGISNFDRENHVKKANEALAKIGLRVGGSRSDPDLFLPNKVFAGLARLFEGSPWANGVWAQAARRVPGAVPSSPLHLAGVSTRGTKIPLKAIAGLCEFPTTGSAGAAPPPPSSTDSLDMEDFA